MILFTIQHGPVKTMEEESEKQKDYMTGLVFKESDKREVVVQALGLSLPQLCFVHLGAAVC